MLKKQSRKIKNVVLLTSMGILLLALVVSMRMPIVIPLLVVKYQPDYFLVINRNGISEESLLLQSALRLFNYKMLRDWIAESVKSTDAETSSVYELMVGSIMETRKVLISADEYAFEYRDMPPFVRLVSGVSYCDGMNQLTSLILAEYFGPVQLWSLYDKDDQSSPHTLIRLNYLGVDYYLDSFYATSPVFSFTSMEPKVPGYSQLDSLMPENYYFDGFNFLETKPMALPIGIFNIQSISSIGLGFFDEGLSAQQAYLFGRIHHLYGYDKAALKYYDRSLKLCKNEFFCGVIDLLKKRIEDEYDLTISKAG